MPRLTAERRMRAYNPDDDSANIVHSAAGAARFGFRGSVVTGVIPFGWATPTIMSVLGDGWRQDGWTEVRFRQPVYADEDVRVVVEPEGDSACAFTVARADGERAVVGHAGLGRAPWFGELDEPPDRRRPEPASEPRGYLADVTQVPLGETLRPMGVHISPEEANEWAERVGDDDPGYRGDRPLVHPSWLGMQMYQLLLHSYDQRPSMHYHSQYQYLAPVYADQTLALAGRFIDAWERNGSHYLRIMGGIFGEDGAELTRVRYTTVFRLAERT